MSFGFKTILVCALLCLNAFGQSSVGEKGTLADSIQKAIDGEAASKKKVAAAVAQNAVCPDPNKPCQHKSKKFDVWELSFRMPAKIAANKTYESAPFYAVILKKYELEEDCDNGEFHSPIEKERKFVQQAFPARKVFVEYNGCPNMNAVGYFFTGKTDASDERVLYMNYLAIYAGETLADAKKLLQQNKTEFPQAEIKRMKAQYTWLVQ